MSKNTKQDKRIYLILNTLSWILVIAVFWVKNPLMLWGDFILIILIDLHLITLRKKIKAKNHLNKKK